MGSTRKLIAKENAAGSGSVAGVSISTNSGGDSDDDTIDLDRVGGYNLSEEDVWQFAWIEEDLMLQNNLHQAVDFLNSQLPWHLQVQETSGNIRKNAQAVEEQEYLEG